MSGKITIRKCASTCCVTLVWRNRRWIVTDRDGIEYKAKTYREATKIAIDKGA